MVTPGVAECTGAWLHGVWHDVLWDLGKQGVLWPGVEGRGRSDIKCDRSCDGQN